MLNLLNIDWQISISSHHVVAGFESGYLSTVRIRKTPDLTQYFHLWTTTTKIFPVYEIFQLQKDHLSESKEKGKLIAEYDLINEIHSN